MFSLEVLSVHGRFLDSVQVDNGTGTLSPESEVLEVDDDPLDVLVEVADELEVVTVA